MYLPTLANMDKGPFFLMAGSCAIESHDLAFEIAEKIHGITN
jgi:2-dehydro-3-deoxyphosphooctonate aldolase (KDO 8-P synthase)